MLIGQYLSLPFGGYTLFAALPVFLSLLALWGIVLFLFRGRWSLRMEDHFVDERGFDAWQTFKGGVVLTTVVGLFLFSSLPRDLTSLGAAGILLRSRKMASRRTLEFVDWQLLLLFLGLFVVNAAFEAAGGLEILEKFLESAGISLSSPVWLYGVTTALSNLVSNVPAVMLLLPLVRDVPQAGYILAVSSTFAGNLLLVGSIANIIVASEAERMGIPFDWKQHALVGVPVTLVSLAAGLICFWII